MPAVLSLACPGQGGTAVIPSPCSHGAPRPGPRRSWVLAGAGWRSDGVPTCHWSCLQAGLQLWDVRSRSSSGGTGAAAGSASPRGVPSAPRAHWCDARRATLGALWPDPSRGSPVPSAWLTPLPPPPAVAPRGSGVLCWQRLWGCGCKRQATLLLSDDLSERCPHQPPTGAPPGLGLRLVWGGWLNTTQVKLAWVQLQFRCGGHWVRAKGRVDGREPPQLPAWAGAWKYGPRAGNVDFPARPPLSTAGTAYRDGCGARRGRLAPARPSLAPRAPSELGDCASCGASGEAMRGAAGSAGGVTRGTGTGCLTAFVPAGARGSVCTSPQSFLSTMPSSSSSCWPTSVWPPSWTQAYSREVSLALLGKCLG